MDDAAFQDLDDFARLHGEPALFCSTSFPGQMRSHRDGVLVVPRGGCFGEGNEGLGMVGRVRGHHTKREKSYAKENLRLWRCRVEVNPSLSSGKAAQWRQNRVLLGID